MKEKELPVSIVIRRLDLSRSSVYRLIAAGELPVIRRGPVKGFRVRESEVLAFIRRREMA